MSLSRILVSAIAMAVVLSLGVTTVESAIPNPTSKKFYACFVKKTGVVKVINYPKVSTCPKGQRLISWNAKGPTGTQGAQGVQGVQGVPGPQGPAGEAGITKITLTTWSETVTLNPGSSESVIAQCQAGRVVGGGFSTPTDEAIEVQSSKPDGTTGWRVIASNLHDSPLDATAYVVCMTTEPSTVIATSKVKTAKKRGK